MRRRTVLTCAGSLAIGSLAGCLGPTGAGQRPLATNPAGQHLDQQPRLGPPREETGITLVSFEIPTCANCADFHRRTFPEIRSKWAEQGEATVYARNVQPTSWAVEAVHALEETRLRAPDLYWELKSWYYNNQAPMSKGTVVEKTRSFLADEDVDADAVARAAETKAHPDAIGLDESAYQEAVRIPATPTIFVFEDGEFVTIINNEGFDSFVSAIESHG
jgi:protein-disulfide isomerase